MPLPLTCPNEQHSFLTNLLAQNFPAQNCSTRAHCMPHNTADSRPERLIFRGKGDGCDLAAVAPFRKKRRDESEAKNVVCGGLVEGVALLFLNFSFDFLHFLLYFAFFCFTRLDEELVAEKEKEGDGGVVRELAGEEEGGGIAQDNGQHGHECQCAYCACEHNSGAALHGQQRGDEEGLVANLADDYGTEGLEECVGHGTVSLAGGIPLNCTVCCLALHAAR